MDEGFLKIWRRLFNHELWMERRKKSKFEAWLDMIQMARFSHKPEKRIIGNTVKIISRGQIFISQSALESRWRWSRQEIRGFMSYLKNHDMITCETDRHGSQITLISYNEYNILPGSNINQNSNQPSNHKATNQSDCYSMHCEDEQPEANQPSNQPSNRATTTNRRKEERIEDTYLESSTINKQCIAPDSVRVSSLDLGKHQFDPKKKECDKQAKEVIDYFNEVTGKHAGYRGDGFDKIVALLMSNEPIDALKYVIDTKMHDPDFKRWMTPRTLFGPKYYDYQSEDVKDYIVQPKETGEMVNRDYVIDRENTDFISYDDRCEEKQPDGTWKTYYNDEGDSDG